MSHYLADDEATAPASAGNFDAETLSRANDVAAQLAETTIGEEAPELVEFAGVDSAEFATVNDDEFELADGPEYTPMTRSVGQVRGGRRLLILTCMDYRIDVPRAFGLQPGQAYVVRNAGGRAIEAVRSIIISQGFFGITDLWVVHHTQCGMSKGPALNQQVYTMLDRAFPAHRFLSRTLNFLPLPQDVIGGVRVDIQFLRSHPLVRSNSVRGFVFNVANQRLTEVR